MIHRSQRIRSKKKTRCTIKKLAALCMLFLIGIWLFAMRLIFIPRPAENNASDKLFNVKNASEKLNLKKSAKPPPINYIRSDTAGGQIKSVNTKREYKADETGSAANCSIYTENQRSTEEHHPDEGSLTVYCRRIYYRISVESYRKAGSIIIGVLSAAGGNGPSRRQSIRKTWANGRVGVFFIVAGPWTEISNEYKKYKDLVWIDEKEGYDGERSVLTFKTTSFISIVDILSKQIGKRYGYIFKTDDDSYLDISKLSKQIYTKKSHKAYDYWGWCKNTQVKPLRGPNDKWAVSYETYPEPIYPRYCQGAGFLISHKFSECMAGSGGLFQARYMPFEDVAIGLQAERCSITPRMAENPDQLRMYRANTARERDNVNFNKGKLNEKDLPTPNMVDKILQHRIHSNHDMEEHHKAALDPNYFSIHASIAEIKAEYDEESD